MTPTQKTMIEEFQCPGCVCGSGTDCGAFKLQQSNGSFCCTGHVAGTSVATTHGPATFFLGLPKGFDRLGPVENKAERALNIRLWPKGAKPDWDKLNMAVWALEKDGYLFVRTYMPRVNHPLVDVIEGGTLALCPQAINVGEFIDEID